MEQRDSIARPYSVTAERDRPGSTVLPGMIDCHTHLADGVFDSDRAQVLERALAAGVTHIAVVGQDAKENQAVLRVTGGEPGPNAGPQPRLLAFLGLHPDRFADRLPLPAEDSAEQVEAQIRAHRPRLIGIGEVGLDYWLCQDEARRERQRQAFTRLIDLALELDLPLNVHSRSAGRHALALLRERGAKRVLMHAFDGKAGHALEGAQAGYVFSIPPSIVRTDGGSAQKVKLVRALPLQSLALETDSPVLGPVREERNEPANARLSAARIAEIKGLPEAEVRQALLDNTRRLFGIAG